MSVGRRIRIVTMVSVVGLASGCTGGAAPSSPTAATPSPTAIATVSTEPAPTAKPSKAATAAPPSQPIQVVSPFEDSDVGCTIGAVEAAESNLAPLTTLADCREPVEFSKQVQSGGFVTTDSCGQAVLNSKCGTIYVFQDSGLRFSTCDLETASSGAGCLTDGTIAWNNSCPAGVAEIVTPTASITLNGTWVSATYLPDRQLSLFTVLEGEAVATPLDPSGSPSGAPQDIPRDAFWFTGPDGEPAIVGGLDAQRVHPIEALPPVIVELQLESWIAAVKARADADGVRSGLEADPVINIRARGGPIDDEQRGLPLQNSLLMAMDWSSALTQTFPDGNGSIFMLIGDFPSRNAAFMSHSPEAAAEVIRDIGLAGTSITLIVEDSGELPSLGKNYSAFLQEVNLDIEFVALPPDDAAALYEERGSADLPTIWLSTR